MVTVMVDGGETHAHDLFWDGGVLKNPSSDAST